MHFVLLKVPLTIPGSVESDLYHIFKIDHILDVYILVSVNDYISCPRNDSNFFLGRSLTTLIHYG
jgi:hypothetical protein